MNAPSLEFLAGPKPSSLPALRRLAALVVLVTVFGACEQHPAGPAATGQVSMDVRFLSAPPGLSTLSATLTSSGLPTATITLTPVSGTDNREWSGGPATLATATYSVDIQGRDASGSLTYRGSGTVVVGAGTNTPLFVALVCVNAACEQTSGTVTVLPLVPQLEVEPNNTAEAANPLTVFSLLGGQLEAGLANGVISPGSASDADVFSFAATGLAGGDTIVVVLHAKGFGTSTLDGTIELYDASGGLLIGAGNGTGDPVITFPVPDDTPPTATYTVDVAGFAPAGGSSSTGRYTVLVAHCKPGGSNHVACRDLAAATPAPACAPAPSGLVHWWPGEGNSRDLVGGDNGAVQGGVTFSSGEVSQAFRLNGTDGFVDLGTSPSFEFGSADFTIEFWVLWNSLEGSNPTDGAQIMIEKFDNGDEYGGTTLSGWSFAKLPSNELEFGGVTGGNEVFLHATPPGIGTGAWHHVAVTRGAGLVTLYWDGEPIGTVAIASFDPTAQSLKLGRRSDDRGLFHNGLLDEVSIYNRALGAREIQSIFAANNAGKCPPPSPPPSSGWHEVAPMPTARSYVSTATINGLIYAVGGTDGAATLATLEAYDPTTNTWTTKAPMPTARYGLGVAAINGILYAVGGQGDAHDQAPALATLEAYDPATNTWATKAPMPTARWSVGVTAVNGILYALGGSYGEGAVATVEAYDPATNTWTTRSAMPTPRTRFGTAVINGLLYAVGGDGCADSSCETVEAYNPVANTWTTKAPMTTGRYGPGVAVINGLLYAVGGVGFNRTVVLSSVEVYDPSLDRWTPTPSMPTARATLDAAALNGVLYAIGGYDSDFNVLATVEAFQP